MRYYNSSDILRNEYYMRAEKYDANYTVLMLLIEFEAFIVGVFFSMEHIKKWRGKGKVRINYVFAILAVLLIILHTPVVPLNFFRMLRVPILVIMTFFWYALAHTFYKIPIEQGEFKDK